MRSIDEIHEDISIASEKLSEQKLINLYHIECLICEHYCIPAHNHFAYFAQIYEVDNKIMMVYIRNEIINSITQIKNCMSTFKRAIEVEQYNAYQVEYIMGVVKLSDGNIKRINKLLSLLPKENYEAKRKYITIDSCYNLFRIYRYGEVINEISYRSGNEIIKENISEEVIEFVETINRHLERDMGYDLYSIEVLY